MDLFFFLDIHLYINGGFSIGYLSVDGPVHGINMEKSSVNGGVLLGKSMGNDEKIRER